MTASNEFDVVVLGAGAGGMAAAVVAATEGLKVCLLEKTEHVGGTTAWSGGMVWAPLSSPAQKSTGFKDTTRDVARYLEGVVPGSQKDPGMAAFLNMVPTALDYFERHTLVKFRSLSEYPDYYQELEGSSVSGRVLEPEPFNSAHLGAHLRDLRLPLPEFALFSDMMVAREDLSHFQNVFRSIRSFGKVGALLSRYAYQKIRWGRGVDLVLGNALAGRLYASVLEAGITVRMGEQVSNLHRDGFGRVDGVELLGGKTISARQGVVLATGGFTGNLTLREKYLAQGMGDYSATAPGALGDGLHLAESAGGTFSQGRDGNAFLAPVSRYTRPDGSLAVFPHTVSDRAKPGLIAVDNRGERFVNEAVSYHEFGRALLSHQNTSGPEEAFAWLIADSRFVWEYGLGALKPKNLNKKYLVAIGYLLEGSDLSDLTQKLELPPGSLEDTVSCYNGSAEQGLDPQFGRGGNAYERFLGDSQKKPNPCVAPIQRAPYFAIRVEGGDLAAAGGVNTDASSRVMDESGKFIPGLYACGADAKSIMEGNYPGPGITLGPALAFGFLAAMDIVSSTENAC